MKKLTMTRTPEEMEHFKIMFQRRVERLFHFIRLNAPDNIKAHATLMVLKAAYALFPDEMGNAVALEYLEKMRRDSWFCIVCGVPLPNGSIDNLCDKCDAEIRQDEEVPAVNLTDPDHKELESVCTNCGHAEPHNGPAGTVDDACTHPGCNCGYDSRAGRGM